MNIFHVNLTIFEGGGRSAYRQLGQGQTFKKIGRKLKQVFMVILGLDESLKTINRLDPTVTLFDGLHLGKFIRYGHKILTQSLFQSSIRAIKIWNQNL